MSWADEAKKKLQLNETVQIRPKGNSMKGLIESGQLVTLTPNTGLFRLYIGDIVLVRVGGKDYLHLIKDRDDNFNYLIGNNKGGFNGWVDELAIFGVVLKIED